MVNLNFLSIHILSKLLSNVILYGTLKAIEQKRFFILKIYLNIFGESLLNNHRRIKGCKTTWKARYSILLPPRGL